MTRRLYTLPLNTKDADQEREQLQQQLEQAGLIGQDSRSVERIALDSADVTLTGQFRYGTPYDEKLARELESLSKSSFGAVPLFNDADGETLERAAYYEVDSAEVNQAHPSFKFDWLFNVSLSEAGTQEESWRVVKTNAQDASASNPFLSNGGDDPLLGIDVAASKVRWYTTADGAEPATPAETVESEYGAIERYRPSDSTFDDPELIYELPFEREGRVDVVVWDDFGGSAEFETVNAEDSPQVGDGTQVAGYSAGYGINYGEDYGVSEVEADAPTVGFSVSTRRWQHVFHTAWERSSGGSFVVENGLFRLYFDEQRGLLLASEWDNAASSWQSVPVSHADHLLYDADLKRVNAAEAAFSVQFEDTADGSLSTLDCSLQRGYTRPLWIEPDGATTPQTLIDMLDPIANTDSTDLNPKQGLRTRTEVSES